jgi:hypothetical protein
MERTMRRRLYCALGLVALAVLGFGVVLRWTRPQHNISVDGCEAISRDMTREQVVRLLGVPPGNYSVGNVQVMAGGPGNYQKVPEFAAYWQTWGREATTEIWVGQEAAIVVGFDKQGKVQRADYFLVHRFDEESPDPLLNRLRRFLRL